MIGDYETGRMLTRNGTNVVEDPIEFAREWQVRPDIDGELFQTSRAPQYPAQCVMPAKTFQSRLGDSRMRKMAEQACVAWKDDKDECVMDVMVTRDLAMARHPPNM